MFTVCPKCTLSLAVTAADLRVGQGYVRCGRCANVFNALLALSEEPPPDTSSTRPNMALQVTPPVDDIGDNANDDDIVFDDDAEVELRVDGGVPDEFTTAHDSEAEVVESHGTGTFETIVLEGEGILQTEEFLDEEDTDHEMVQAARQLSGEDAGLATASVPVESARWPWMAGAVALSLLLLVQMVHHWRNELAARPAWNEALTAVYRQLGLSLNPAWSLAAYDVRQLGADADGTGGNAIRVRVSVANLAPRSQPVPTLRLTLLDRYGKQLAARNLPPAEYLPAGSADGQFMSAGQRLDSTVAVADPGALATSFEVDVCLPAAGNTLRCAGDEPPFIKP